MNQVVEEAKWVDNHCHIFEQDIAEAEIQRAIDAGVRKFINVGTDLETSRTAIDLAKMYPHTVFATAGLHPHEASHGLIGIEDLLTTPQVVAVGECGLDFYYNHSPRNEQEKVFAQQIAYANEKNMPLVIHSRDAWDETFTVLDKEGVPSRTVFHCFTGGPEEASEAIARGALLSFSGIVTFKNAQEIREALKITPINRILIETDSPYLAPVPMRGKKNTPAYLPYIASSIATELEVELVELAQTIWTNTHDFYGLPTS